MVVFRVVLLGVLASFFSLVALAQQAEGDSESDAAQLIAEVVMGSFGKAALFILGTLIVLGALLWIRRARKR